MGQSAWRAITVIAAAIFVAAALFSFLYGGCEGAIETAAGSTVPMRCHWTFIAAGWCSVLGAVLSLMALSARTKEGRRLSALAVLALCIATALLPSPAGIGLCPAGMHCHTSASILWGCLALAAVLSIVMLVKADPSQASKPKMKL